MIAATFVLAASLVAKPQSAPLTWNTGSYTYDTAGNVTAIGEQYFVYDPLSRLTTGHVVSPDTAVTQQYTYDAYGNMKTMTGYGLDQTFDPAGGTNHVVGNDYDEAGNITHASAYQYDYDAVGMMTRITTGDPAHPTRVNYVYTADDERLQTILPTETHLTIRGLGDEVLTDLNLKAGTWSFTRDYVYRDGAMLVSSSPVNALYYSVDHLGSPRLLTDDYGVKAALQTFLPYGQELAPISINDGATKKFTGHERDLDPAMSGSPLDYMHARYYSALTGRFLTPDPRLDFEEILKDPKKWNRYVYVDDNPVTLIDPTGLATKTLTEADLVKIISSVVAKYPGADAIKVANLALAKAGSFKTTGTDLLNALTKLGVSIPKLGAMALRKTSSLEFDASKNTFTATTSGFGIPFKGVNFNVGTTVTGEIKSTATALSIVDLSGIDGGAWGRATGLDTSTSGSAAAPMLKGAVHGHLGWAIPVWKNFGPYALAPIKLPPTPAPAPTKK